MKQNQGYCYRLQLDDTAAGHTTLSFLTDRFNHSTETEWADRIRDGQIVVNDRIAAEAQLLSAGMVLMWNRPGWREEDTPQSYIRSPIGWIEHPRLGSVHAADVNGKPARSVARRLLRREDSTIFEVDLHSGRPHQIRIHLAFIGHPLLGDPLYACGRRLVDRPGLPGDLGYHLHAKRLRLEHPITRQRLELVSEVPDILRTDRERTT